MLAFNLYGQIPFGTMHSRNPKVITLAKVLGRSPSSVAFKLANFARLDPALQARGIKGASHGAKGEEEVWREFAAAPESLVFESQRLMAERMGQPLEKFAGIDTRDLPSEGRDREAVVRLRVNQSFFRQRVLSAYNYRCCITGLRVPALLNASHIVPWSKDPANRLNPRNGLCLNALHDRAFDRGLLWIDGNLMVRLTDSLRNSRDEDFGEAGWFKAFDGKPLRLPRQFSPDPALLAIHAAAALGPS